ncbi:MAG: ABC transporter permease subunit [Desulfatiglans sp.]|nr:ABC transporter permease subunit [Desulfatiglans sp.]
MNRLLKLAKKDFSQNILVFIFLPLFLIFIFGIMLLGTAVSPRTMGFLSAEGSFLLFFIPLSAIVLGNRLVVKEYYSRTQLFIESLPISRVEMVLVKYFIGLTFLLFFAVFTLLISSGLSYRSDPVSLNFFSYYYQEAPCSVILCGASFLQWVLQGNSAYLFTC